MKTHITTRAAQYVKASAACFVAAYLAAMPGQASAESFNEDGIRAMYGEMDAVVRNQEKTGELMKSRLDDDYVVSSKDYLVVGSYPPVPSEKAITKSQMILDMPKVYDVTKIVHYTRKIVDVKFSSDKKWAYVSLTTESDGQIHSPAGGSQGVAIDFATASSCVDTVTMKGGRLVIAKSDCKERTTITPPQ